MFGTTFYSRNKSGLDKNEAIAYHSGIQVMKEQVWQKKKPWS